MAAGTLSRPGTTRHEPGAGYDATFGKRMQGEGIWADMIRQRFEKAVARLGIGMRSGRFRTLDISRFRPPSATKPAAPGCMPTPALSDAKNNKTGNSSKQLDLF